MFTVVTLVALFLAFVAGWIWFNSPPPQIPIPTPNGYDVLAQASASVEQSILTEDETKLKEFLALNSGPLREVDKAMQMECVVPIDFNAGMAALPQPKSRDAFRLLNARAKVLHQDGDANAAAIEWAKMFDLATKIDDGGALVHVLSAIGCESMALDGLDSVVAELSPEQKQEVLTILKAAERKPHDFEKIQEIEHAVVRGEYGAIFGGYITAVAGGQSKNAMDAGRDADARVIGQLETVVKALQQ